MSLIIAKIDKCSWCDNKAEWLIFNTGFFTPNIMYFVCNKHRLERARRYKEKWRL